jgi:hypothetical protein
MGEKKSMMNWNTNVMMRKKGVNVIADEEASR